MTTKNGNRISPVTGFRMLRAFGQNKDRYLMRTFALVHTRQLQLTECWKMLVLYWLRSYRIQTKCDHVSYRLGMLHTFWNQLPAALQHTSDCQFCCRNFRMNTYMVVFVKLFFAHCYVFLNKRRDNNFIFHRNHSDKALLLPVHKSYAAVTLITLSWISLRQFSISVKYLGSDRRSLV